MLWAEHIQQAKESRLLQEFGSKPGNGIITVNGRKEEIYFSSKSHRLLLNQPLISSNRKTEVDIVCTVKGGGLSGQAGAIRHGISKALVNF